MENLPKCRRAKLASSCERDSTLSSSLHNDFRLFQTQQQHVEFWNPKKFTTIEQAESSCLMNIDFHRQVIEDSSCRRQPLFLTDTAANNSEDSGVQRISTTPGTPPPGPVVLPQSPAVAPCSSALHESLSDVFPFSSCSLPEMHLGPNDTPDDSAAENGTMISSSSSNMSSKPHSDQGFDSTLSSSPLLPPRLLELGTKAWNPAMSTDDSCHTAVHDNDMPRRNVQSPSPGVSSRGTNRYRGPPVLIRRLMTTHSQQRFDHPPPFIRKQHNSLLGHSRWNAPPRLQRRMYSPQFVW